jgi:hypothetical protein
VIVPPVGETVGEGTAAEDPVDGERDSHSVDLRNMQESDGSLGHTQSLGSR